MNKVLYLTNIKVPYRVRFFNELAKYCDLTVLYERKNAGSRDERWSESEQQNYRACYLSSIPLPGENGFSFGILKTVFSGYDRIVVGCYNSPAQMMAMLAMRLFRIPYIINLDGEPFLDGSGVKTKLKKFFLTEAEKYLVAGEKAAQSLSRHFPGKETVTYYFSSLTQQEISQHRNVTAQRSETILIPGQHFDYKGLDVALAAAEMDPSLHYKFIGMGRRTERFLRKHTVPENVEIVPFLQREALEAEYRSCGMLVLPSRRECWGLVINEAASFGMPIVSTWGSGAAVEFLGDDYPQLLAQPADPEDLLRCIKALREMKDSGAYRDYLLDKSREYSIDRSVQEHLKALQ